MKPFMDSDFLLHTKTAQSLYHEYAASLPIFDYHCHVPPSQIAENTQFSNLTQVWLGGDHYKWRAMRTVGIDEELITGSADDWDKFLAWAKTVPKTAGNPLYHWTHLELKRVFGIHEPLNEHSAREIYTACNARLAEEAFRVRGLISSFNVTALCTTDDPTDSLEYHKQIAQDPNFFTTVLPAWRPDKAHALENPDTYQQWISSLEEVSQIRIHDFDSLLAALDTQHQFFHDTGCRISDHGLTTIPFVEPGSTSQLKDIFGRTMKGERVSDREISSFRVALLTELGKMDARRGWCMQLHLGALRNVNTRMFASLGPDTGFDVMGDWPIAEGLTSFLDSLDQQQLLPKTILYVLNPRDNDMIASITGAFQDGKTPGKIQFGSGWWFNDQLDGMKRQLNTLASVGLLSTFVGMLTDSRSFLSYPRHEYFRRLVCSIIGDWIESGEVPADMDLFGSMVQDISYRNAVRYFTITLKEGTQK